MTGSVGQDIDIVQPSEMIGGRIPMLDVAPFLAGEPGALRRLAGELRFAYEKVGFFYMRGHGVPRPLIDGVFTEAARFHAQDLERKLALKIDHHNIGYVPMKGSTNRTYRENGDVKPNLNEAFFIKRERSPDDPDLLANKVFSGLNRWPADLPGFRETTLAYMQVLEQLGKRLVGLYATALGLPSDWFDASFENPSISLRLTHYPAAERYEDKEFSLAPHTDSGFMTLLAPNRIAGLSICLPDGAWIDAPAVEDAYVVNAGDILHRWTNERFLSTRHRVVNRSGVERYAIPFFFNPHPDVMIECLPTCRSADNPPKYEPISVGDYLLSFAKKNYEHMQKPAPAPT